MDVKNFAVNLANLAKTTVFTGENNVAGKQGSPKTNNFYDKLNNAVERSEKINTNGEADLQAAETLEKNPVLPDENIVLEEDAPEDAVATDAEDKPLIAVDAPIIDNIPVVTAEMPIVSGTVPVVNAEAPVVVNGTAPVIAEPPANNAGATVVVANILAQLDPFQPQANAVTTGKAALYAAAEQSQHVLPEQQIVDPKTGMLSAAEETTLLDPLIGAKTAKPQQIIHPGTIPHNMIAGDETPQPNAPATPAAAKGELPLFLKAQPEIMAQQLKGIETQLKTIMEQQQQLQASPQTQAEAIKTTLDFNVVKPVAPIIVEPGKLNAPMIQGETAAGEMANVKVAAETPAQNLNQQDGQFSLLDQKTTAATTPTPNLEANNSQQFTLPTENAAPTPSDKLPNPAEAAPPKTAANFTAPRDDYQIKNQIVAQAALINRSAQESEMVIRLKPQHLGEMALKVTVNNGIVNAAIHTNNAEVRGILENSLHQLKQDLANVGLKVDNVSISAGLSQFAADQERAMQWQQSQRFSSSRKGGESYEDALDSIAATQTVVNSSTQDGVDYRI